MKILLDKKLPKTLDEDFEREFSKRKDRIYPFLKPMLAKDNYLEYISEQNLKDFFYKGVLRDEAIPEMIAKEKGVKIQDLSIAKIQDFKINSPRQSIEQALEIKPLSEFGTNYAEFYRDGQGAVKKLLAEKQGQVAGAFYRDDLAKSTGTGEIDLVWGDEKIGLKKIIEKHLSDFADFKGDTAQDKLANALGEIIANGKIVENAGVNTIIYKIGNDEFRVGLSKGFNGAGDNQWIITAYQRSRQAQNFDQVANKVQSGNNLSTSGNDESIARRRTNLPSSQSEVEKATSTNTNNIIPQQTIESTMQKFHYDEKKAKDLLEWHKDSSPITKNEDGTPKVFYHGSGNEFEIFDMSKSNNGWGFWFANNYGMASEYDNLGKGKIYEVFINTKKPFNLLDESVSKNDIKRIIGDDLMNEIYDRQGYLKNYDTWEKEDIVELRAMLMPDGLDNYMYALNVKELKWGKKIRQKLQAAGYDSIIGSKDDPRKYIVVFDNKQIKSIDNKDSWTDSAGKITKEKPSDESARHSYFNAQSPNILQSNPHLGAGLVGGTLNGLETDEDGNITGFDPVKFAMGFLGGSLGSKAVSKIYNNKSAQRHATLAIKSIQQDYKALSEKNPIMFAKIMQKIDTRDFLKGKKQVEEVSKDIFNKELAQAIESALQNGKVEVMPKAQFRNKEEFAALFDSVSGNKGIMQTPYKEVKADIKSAWKHFTYNTHNTDRENIKGGFFKTFKDPLFIVEQAREGQSSPDKVVLVCISISHFMMRIKS
ncbi:hypothetical protein HFN_0251 [Helicobacter fennelliae MRY12-0050]|uniref:Uncharacterized protein n=3 Tax=Helicobacter fennelliae TaxID=215 RepID=T1CYV3_9HELI|nr:hypothetical protein HFN_0251 [Helicobacter fennelliae MRY12-0050]